MRVRMLLQAHSSSGNPEYSGIDSTAPHLLSLLLVANSVHCCREQEA